MHTSGDDSLERDPRTVGPAEAVRPGGQEWFAKPDPASGEVGLRFSCTMCGNCCSGPSGYVLVNDEELAKLAARLGVTVREFEARYTTWNAAGRSLVEKEGPHGVGYDCVFLDRTTVPGKAVCGVYEDRPTQCRTWPFWPSLMKRREAWEAARQVCPGIGKGERIVPPEQIRILRDAVRV